MGLDGMGGFGIIGSNDSNGNTRGWTWRLHVISMAIRSCQSIRISNGDSLAILCGSCIVQSMDTKQYTFCEDSISDLFKDAYGSRPGQGFWDRWLEASDEEKQAEWDWLCQVLEQEQARQEINYNSCIARLEERITKLQECGAKNRAMAIRWLDDAYDTGGDISFLEWHLGVPYGYLKGYN